MKKIICMLVCLCLALTPALGEVYTVKAIGGRLELEFNEEYFTESSYKYNHSLMRATLIVSQTGYGTDANFGETGDFNREACPEAAAAEMGFEDFRAYNYDISLNDTSDYAAYSFAHRRLSEGSELIMIVVRCAEYGCGFSSNFRVGTEDIHQGFGTPAIEMAEALTAYIAEYLPGERVKLWTTGYSRAAAVANVAGKLFDDMAVNGELNCSPEDIFTYTFATPATVREGTEGQGTELYENIYNIISYQDIVPEVPIGAWGYTRFGITRMFGKIDEELTDEEANSLYAEVRTAYRRYSGSSMDLGGFRALRDKIDDTLASMLRTIKSGEEYNEYWEALFVNFLQATSGRARRDGISDEVVELLQTEYAGSAWAQFALEKINSLSAVSWTSEPVCVVLSEFGTEAVYAMARIGGIAALTEAVAGDAYSTLLAYLTLADMSAREIYGTVWVMEYAQVVKYVPMLSVFLGFMECFEGHMPAYYYAFLTTLPEEELF